MKCFYVDDLKGESPLYSKVLKASLTGGLTVVCSLSQFSLSLANVKANIYTNIIRYDSHICTITTNNRLFNVVTAYLML